MRGNLGTTYLNLSSPRLGVPRPQSISTNPYINLQLHPPNPPTQYILPPNTKMSILTSWTLHKTTKIAHLTITRPKKLNSLTTPLLTTLTSTLHQISKTPNLLAITLTGAGPKSFIGGADLTELSTLPDAAAARKFITNVHGACTAIRTCPVPIIARINGFALGAGLEIAAACDLRVAGRGSVFGMPEVCFFFLSFFFVTSTFTSTFSMDTSMILYWNGMCGWIG